MYQILHVVAPVEQAAVGGDRFSVDDFGSPYIGNSGQSGKDALTVQVTKSPFYIILCKEGGIDDIRFFTEFCKTDQFRCDF